MASLTLPSRGSYIFWTYYLPVVISFVLLSKKENNYDLIFRYTFSNRYEKEDMKLSRKYLFKPQPGWGTMSFKNISPKETYIMMKKLTELKWKKEKTIYEQWVFLLW